MSDTTSTDAADQTSADGDTTSTDAAAATDATQATTEVRDPAKLLSAYEAEKGKRKQLETEQRELRTRLDALEAEKNGKQAEFEAAQAAQKFKDEALAAANARILKAEVRAAATGKLSDPADALQFLNLSEFEVGSDGEVDSAAVAAAIDNLITTKPYLAAQRERFQGTADGGARNDASKPSQLTREDMKRMSPEQIAEAHEKGQFATLLGP